MDPLLLMPNWDIKYHYGSDPDGKLSLLMDWVEQSGQEIEYPRYTRNFRGVLAQIEEGCRRILCTLQAKR